MEQYIGMVFPWPLSYAPQGWHMCDGTILQISQNQALFAIIGNLYGGDGKTTFALPDLRGKVPVGVGISPVSGSKYMYGATGGATTVAITTPQMPQHTHTTTITPSNFSASASMLSNTAPAVSAAPNAGNNKLGSAISPDQDPGGGGSFTINAYINTADNNVVQMPNAVQVTTTPSAVSINIANAGGSTGHNNMQPYTAINFIIATTGYFPPRP